MKKLLYLSILILLIFSVLAKKTNASFFDDWWKSIRGLTVTTTTIYIQQNQTNNINTLPKANVICFINELEVGSDNNDVKKLQQFLYDQGFYKEGLITGYFGVLTRKAVMNFQSYYANEILKPTGLLKSTGYVGQATLKKLNGLTGCNSNDKNINNINMTNLNINVINTNFNFENNQHTPDSLPKLSDLIITDLVPKNWKELTEKDPEAMSCRLKPGNCISYSPGHNRAWVTEKNIGKVKSGEHLIVIYQKQSVILLGNTAKYVPVAMIKAPSLNPSETKTHEFYLLLVASCFDGNVFNTNFDFKAVVYNENANNVIKKIEEQGKLAYSNDILTKLRNLYNKEDQLKVADFWDTEFARELVKFKNSTEVNSYIGFQEENINNNEFLTNFKCGSKVRNYDELIKQYGIVAGQAFSGNRSFACREGEGNYSHEECYQMTTNTDKLNLFLKSGKEPYIPRLTSYYCNQLTGQCIDGNYIMRKLDGEACDFYKGPYRYYESGDGIDNNCTKECIREYSFYEKYVVNIFDIYSCHPILYNLFKTTTEKVVLDNKVNSVNPATSPDTTTTTRQRPATNTCYRCSYPQQACMITSDACDDNDTYWLDECDKFCKPGYKLKARTSWYTCDINSKRCIESLQQGPVFMSESECKNDCKNNLNNLFNNYSLPDLAVKIVNIETFPLKGYSIITAKIKNIGKATAVCRLLNGQEAMFRWCVSAFTRSSVNCKQNAVWDDGVGCCKSTMSDTTCLDNSLIYKKGSLDFPTGPGEKMMDYGNNVTKFEVQDNNSSKLEPGEEMTITYQSFCIEKDNDVYIIVDPSRFESDAESIANKHIGYFLKYNFLSFPPFMGAEKWKYGNIKESNELNNAGYIRLGCAINAEFCDGASNPYINVIESIGTYQ